MSRFHRHDFDLLPERAFRPYGPRGQMTLHGKGGAPAPDPRLAEAQIKSMQIQDDSIQEILAQQRELQPLQKEQLQFGLDTSKQAYEQSQADREWMLSRRGMLSGTQDKMVADAATFDTEAKREELAGTALTDVNTAFGAARGQAARTAAAYGITPGSGRAMAMNAQMTTAQALASAGVMTGVRRAARDEGRALTDRAQNALAGYPAMGLAATGAGAGYGASGVDLANKGAAGIYAGSQSAAQIAGGMGTNATSMFGVQQQAATEANKQKGQMMGSLVGAGATLGAAFI